MRRPEARPSRTPGAIVMLRRLDEVAPLKVTPANGVAPVAVAPAAVAPASEAVEAAP